LQDQYFLEQGEESTQLVTYSVLGPFFKADFDVPEAIFLEELLIRPDVRIPDPDSDKVYIEEFHGATMFLESTQNILIEEGEGSGVIAYQLDWFMGEWDYDSSTNGTCFGQDCQIFYFNDTEDNLDVYIMASMDNYLIGLNASGQDYLQTNRMEYIFENITLHDFVLNKTFEPCNDTRAFKVPNVKNPCPKFSFPFLSRTTGSPSSNWVPLTGVAVSLVVLVAVVASFFFLI